MSKTTRRSQSDALDRLAQQIGPHLGTGSIKRSLLEDALATIAAGSDVRALALGALESARIRIVEDRPHASAAVAVAASTQEARHRVRRPDPEEKDPVHAGRRRLEADRLRPARSRHNVILSAEEEVGLTLIARPDGLPLDPGGFGLLQGERREAAEAMLLHNLRLAHGMARSYAGQGLEHDDMYSHALIGLMRAVELFDPAAGYKFSTYATHWLRQAVTRAIANEARAIRIPVHMWEVVRKVGAARERLTVDGAPPSVSRLASELHLDVERVHEALRLLPAVLSLETPLGDDQFTLGDLVDAQVDLPEHIEVRGFYPEDVDELLLLLDYKEADILRRRFAMPPYDEVATLDDIGKVYGVTRERIRQIESKAKLKVRSTLARRGYLVEPRDEAPKKATPASSVLEIVLHNAGREVIDMDECVHGMTREWCSTCQGTDTPPARAAHSGFHGGETKQDLLHELCDALGIPREPVGTGSSLPSHVFEAAARQAGVPTGSMPEIGRAVVEKAGRTWTSDCDSTGSVSGGGSTVTASGLSAMVDALRRL